jgi:transposase
MANRKFHLTEAQVKELIQAFRDCGDGPLRTRYQAVRLYGSHYPVAEILALTRCSRTSLMEWCAEYAQAGLAGLTDGRLGGNDAKLSVQQRVELQHRLETYTPQQLFGSATQTPDGKFWTVEDLQHAIRHGWNVTYASRSSYYTLFHACGFSYQRPAKVFKSQRPLQLMDFEEHTEKN